MSEQIDDDILDYDVVVDTLQGQIDALMKMNTQNTNMGMFGIMDQIRFEHMDTLSKAIKLWEKHKEDTK